MRSLVRLEMRINDLLSDSLNQANLKEKVAEDEPQKDLEIKRSHVKNTIVERWKKYEAALLEQDEKTERDIQRIIEQIDKYLEMAHTIDKNYNDLKSHILNKREFSHHNPAKRVRDLEDETVIDSPVFCFTCGILLTFKAYTRHCEKCFKRVETSISYGASYPSSSGIYCDFYDTAEDNYCKRLKGVCYEHSKHIKPLKKEICGHPLNGWPSEDCNLSIDNMCLHPKTQCSRHLEWEKLKFAYLANKKKEIIKIIDNLTKKGIAYIEQRNNRWNIEYFYQNDSIVYF